MSSVLALSSVRLQVFARSIQRLLSTEGKSKYSEEYFKEAVGKRNMVVFMKGIPSEPMCGFSRLVIQILNMHGKSCFVDAHQ
jgi:monothiol glutaredoxin